MKEIQIEHKEKDLPFEVMHEFKKESLRNSLGLSEEAFDDLLGDAKEFFNLNKKEILKEGKISKKKDTEHSSVTSRY